MDNHIKKRWAYGARDVKQVTEQNKENPLEFKSGRFSWGESRELFQKPLTLTTSSTISDIVKPI
jgi:hypothetical protein